MASVPAWDSPIRLSPLFHCRLLFLLNYECRVRELSWAIFFDGRAVPFTFPSSSTPRFTCSLSGSLAAAAILVASARTSPAWDVSIFDNFSDRPPVTPPSRRGSSRPPKFVEVGARIYIPLGDIDDFAVERDSALASGIEGPLKCRRRCVESILRAVLDLAALIHGLLGRGCTLSGYRGLETELGRRGAIIFARLFGSSLGIGGGIHHRASWGDIARFRGLAAAEPRSP